MTKNSINLWEEKNSTDQKKNSIKNEENDRCVTIGETEKISTKNEWSITTKLMLIKMIAPPPVIYLIENEITGGRYVGQTIRDIKYRWNTHRKAVGEFPLYRAMRKYGIENFKFSILEISATYKQLDELEKKHIKDQKSFIKFGFGGYNLTPGGNGIRIQSQETFEKLSKRFSGKNNPNYGKHHSVETKEKIAKTKRGKVLTEEHKSKIRESTLIAFKNLPVESWKRMCAPGDRNLDKRVYSFKNKFARASFIGMRHELYTKYSLNKNLLRRMIKGELSHTKGWELVTSSDTLNH